MTDLELEALAVVEKLNDEGMTENGTAGLVFTSSPGFGFSINWGLHTVWCSEDDDRRNLGTCPHCKGSGKDASNPGIGAAGLGAGICGHCGGDGKNPELYESLESYVRRELQSMAGDLVMTARGPRDLVLAKRQIYEVMRRHMVGPTVQDFDKAAERISKDLDEFGFAALPRRR